MAESVYVVTTTLGPTYSVGQAEYEQLTEQGLIASTVSVYVPAAKVVISTTLPTTPPPTGTVLWFNPSAP
jgi:hypothetical protein